MREIVSKLLDAPAQTLTAVLIVSWLSSYIIFSALWTWALSSLTR